MIGATWENVLAYRLSDDYDAQILTTYVQDPDTRASLASRKISDDDKAFPLRDFVLRNNDLNDSIYRFYIRMLPKFLSEFPTVDPSKLEILIEERRIDVTPANLAHLLSNLDLQVLFVTLNFDAYADNPTEFDINDQFRKELLRTTLSYERKMRVILEMKPTFVVTDSQAASLIGPVIVRATEGVLERLRTME